MLAWNVCESLYKCTVMFALSIGTLFNNFHLTNISFIKVLAGFYNRNTCALRKFNFNEILQLLKKFRTN